MFLLGWYLSISILCWFTCGLVGSRTFISVLRMGCSTISFRYSLYLYKSYNSLHCTWWLTEKCWAYACIVVGSFELFDLQRGIGTAIGYWYYRFHRLPTGRDSIFVARIQRNSGRFRNTVAGIFKIVLPVQNFGLHGGYICRRDSSQVYSI
jgi:hypothetical protein